RSAGRPARDRRRGRPPRTRESRPDGRRCRGGSCANVGSLRVLGSRPGLGGPGGSGLVLGGPGPGRTGPGGLVPGGPGPGGLVLGGPGPGGLGPGRPVLGGPGPVALAL